MRIEQHVHNERWKLYRQGKTDQEIARELSIGKSTVTTWRKKYNLPAHGRERNKGDDNT